jgi:hypothetical protein
MSQVRHQRASTARTLARIVGGLLFPLAFFAAAGEPPAMLVHRFTIDEPDEWVSIELRPMATLWHQGINGSRTVRFDDVRAVLGSLKGVAIGARCPGRSEGPVHYSCALDVDVSHHGDGADALEGWTSSTTYKLVRPDEGTVSALSAPNPAPGSIAVAGEAGLLALVAPEALEAQWAQDRPLRVRVRVRPAPVADDGSSIDAARRAHAKTFPAQGVIVISTQSLRPLSAIAKPAQPAIAKPSQPAITKPAQPAITKPAPNGKHHA